MKIKFLPLLICFVLSSTMLNAQSKYTGLSFGIKTGVTSTFSDIRSNQYWRTIDFKTRKYNEYQGFIGVHGLYMFSNILGIYGESNFGQVKGIMTNRNHSSKLVKSLFSSYRYPRSEDYNLYQRLGYSVPIYVVTKFLDFNVNLYLNISNFGMYRNLANNKNAARRKFGFYGYAGAGLITYNATVKNLADVNAASFADDIYYLHGYITKKNDAKKLFRVTDVQFTGALGVKYKLSNSIDLSAEATMHFVTSDKFDATVDYLNPATQVLGSHYTSANRWASYANDKFATYSIKVGYKWGCNKPGNYNIEWNDPQEAILKKVDNDASKLRELLNDSDKDGVSDAFDKEPNTPAGVRVDGAGQALDVDYDGVADYKDDEIYSPKGSTVNELGVSADTDGDGVADVKDMEPNSAANALVNFRGVTIGKRENTPTPTTPTPTADAKQTYIFPSVYFDLNSAVLKPVYYDQLADVARILIKYPNLKISIFGNADQRGNDSYNDDLGKRRAEAVGNYLKNNFKIDASRIIAVNSYGRSKPISTTHAPNRRVDILSNETF